MIVYTVNLSIFIVKAQITKITADAILAMVKKCAWFHMHCLIANGIPVFGPFQRTWLLHAGWVYFFLESSGFCGWEAINSNDLAISGGVVGTTFPTAW